MQSKYSDRQDLTRYNNTASIDRIDREKGIVYGVSMITVGEAKGHGEFVDETMRDQVLEAQREKEPLGTKCRFDHPAACSRAMGSHVGRFKDSRSDGGHARADLHIAAAAGNSPDGDLRTYIMDLAEEDPQAFSTSIVFKHAKAVMVDKSLAGKDGQPPEDDPYWLPHVRLESLSHCDVVTDGAANADGIFGRPDYWGEQAERFAEEHPNVIGRMIAKYYEWKQKQEDEKMETQELKDVQAELATMTKKAEDSEKELTAEKAKVKTLEEGEEKTEEDKLAEAKETGVKEGAARLTERMEKYKDSSFVIETIEMSDDEVKDAYIAKLEAGEIKKDKKKETEGGDGQTAANYSEEVDDDDHKESKTFEAKVAEKEKEEGVTHGQAIRFCAEKWPKLHKEYNARMTKERHGDSDEDE